MRNPEHTRGCFHVIVTFLCILIFCSIPSAVVGIYYFNTEDYSKLLNEYRSQTVRGTMVIRGFKGTLGDVFDGFPGLGWYEVTTTVTSTYPGRDSNGTLVIVPQTYVDKCEEQKPITGKALRYCLRCSECDAEIFQKNYEEQCGVPVSRRCVDVKYKECLGDKWGGSVIPIVTHKFKRCDDIQVIDPTEEITKIPEYTTREEIVWGSVGFSLLAVTLTALSCCCMGCFMMPNKKDYDLYRFRTGTTCDQCLFGNTFDRECCRINWDGEGRSNARAPQPPPPPPALQSISVRPREDAVATSHVAVKIDPPLPSPLPLTHVSVSASATSMNDTQTVIISTSAFKYLPVSMKFKIVKNVDETIASVLTPGLVGEVEAKSRNLNEIDIERIRRIPCPDGRVNDPSTSLERSFREIMYIFLCSALQFESNVTGNCPITLDDFEYGDILYKCSRCKSHFKYIAFRDWQRQHETCPVCRMPHGVLYVEIINHLRVYIEPNRFKTMTEILEWFEPKRKELLGVA